MERLEEKRDAKLSGLWQGRGRQERLGAGLGRGGQSKVDKGKRDSCSILLPFSWKKSAGSCAGKQRKEIPEGFGDLSGVENVVDIVPVRFG